jgi:hypothetical protein
MENVEKVEKEDESKKCKLTKPMLMRIGAVVAVFAVLGLAYYFSFKRGTITADQAKEKVVKFVTENLVQPGTKIEVAGVSKESGLYKVVIRVEKQEVPTYITKDGKTFFPSAMALEKKEEAKAPEKSVEVPKSDKPTVELFVMSYCPYGTQIEKGILPVLDVLKDKIYFSLKFVDYAMHGEKEIKENLRQYCIQKEEPGKLAKYLGCFLKKGEGTENSCLQLASVNAPKVNGCMASADKEFKITEQFKDKNSWSSQFPPFNVDKEANDKYGVQGSPALVINGVETPAGRDAKSLLEAICSGFSNAPEECKKELSGAAPTPGFGEGSASTNSSASCGS